MILLCIGCHQVPRSQLKLRCGHGDMIQDRCGEGHQAAQGDVGKKVDHKILCPARIKDMDQTVATKTYVSQIVSCWLKSFKENNI